jgi:hypothetical protein
MPKQQITTFCSQGILGVNKVTWAPLCSPQPMMAWNGICNILWIAWKLEWINGNGREEDNGRAC